MRESRKKQPQPTLIEPYVIRAGSRDVCQHYSVTGLGRFAPRVIVLPNGAFYSRDLELFPWPQNRSTAVMPMAVD